jgi:hypothetical protein
MRMRALLVTCSAICLFATVTPRAQQSVTASGQRRTIDCKGQRVQVGGNTNDVTLRGECPRVDVTGVGNTVAIDVAGSIDVTGTSNRVTWQRALKGAAPRISTTGLNSVQQARGTERASDSKSAGATTPSPDAAKPTGKPTPPDAKPDSRRAGSTGQSYSSSSEDVKVLTDNGEDVVDCRGRRVSVLGDGNRLTLRGECPDVMVAGDRNTLSVEIATLISLNGDDNRLTWTRAAAGSEPRIKMPGARNRVTRQTP